MERRALAALGATGGPESRVRIGRRIRREGQILDAPTQAMLELRKRMRYPAWHEQAVPQARETLRHEALVAAGRTIPVASVEDFEVDGAVGPLPARLYRPGGVANPALTWQPTADALPMLIFFHGGGFVLGDRDSHDALCRMLCRSAGILVLSVEYRLAPEHPWPAAPDDADAAWRWAAANAVTLGADPERLAVGGDSAGGNLSAIVAQTAAREEADGGPSLAMQLLLYPATDWSAEYASRTNFGTSFYLEKASMDWCERHYLGDPDRPDAPDPADPRVSPLRAADLSGLAPALLVTAGFDPLRDEGEAYAAALAAAGTPVLARRMPDLIHGFANTLGVGRRPRAAMLEITALMRGMLEIAPATRAAARGRSNVGGAAASAARPAEAVAAPEPAAAGD